MPTIPLSNNGAESQSDKVLLKLHREVQGAVVTVWCEANYAQTHHRLRVSVVSDVNGEAHAVSAYMNRTSK